MSVYVRDGFRNRGVATALYAALLDILAMQGYCSAFAAVTLPNEESERFHEQFGFGCVGVCHNAGFKLGAWHHVKWYELGIRPLPQQPPAPLPLRDVDRAALEKALLKNTGLIRN